MKILPDKKRRKRRLISRTRACHPVANVGGGSSPSCVKHIYNHRMPLTDREKYRIKESISRDLEVRGSAAEPLGMVQDHGKKD
jgi:hypothetical protein